MYGYPAMNQQINYPSMMNNLANPMGMNMQSNIPVNNSLMLTRVTGLEGAKAYQMPPNSTVALFDNNDDLMYIKTTDGAPVQGATAIATATAIGNIVTLPISALVRLNCDCDTANLTIVIGGQAVTAQNLAFVVEKI